MRLTISRYYTPSGHAIQADGVHPDVAVETKKDEGAVSYREKDLEGHLAAQSMYRKTTKGGFLVERWQGVHILMIGSPGTGKSMLAQRLPTILPPLMPVESLETTRIYSAMGRLTAEEPLMKQRPGGQLAVLA